MIFIINMNPYKKEIIYRFISTTLIIGFLFTDISYGIDMPGKSGLRVPLAGSDRGQSERIQTAGKILYPGQPGYTFAKEKEFRRLRMPPNSDRSFAWGNVETMVEPGIRGVVAAINTLPFAYTSSWSHSGLPSDHRINETFRQYIEDMPTTLQILGNVRYGAYTNTPHAGFISMRLDNQSLETEEFLGRLKLIDRVSVVRTVENGPFGPEQLILLPVPSELVDAGNEEAYEAYLKGKWLEVLNVIRAMAETGAKTAEKTRNPRFSQQVRISGEISMVGDGAIARGVKNGEISLDLARLNPMQSQVLEDSISEISEKVSQAKLDQDDLDIAQKTLRMLEEFHNTNAILTFEAKALERKNYLLAFIVPLIGHKEVKEMLKKHFKHPGSLAGSFGKTAIKSKKEYSQSCLLMLAQEAFGYPAKQYLSALLFSIAYLEVCNIEGSRDTYGSNTHRALITKIFGRYLEPRFMLPHFKEAGKQFNVIKDFLGVDYLDMDPAVMRVVKTPKDLVVLRGINYSSAAIWQGLSGSGIRMGLYSHAAESRRDVGGSTPYETSCLVMGSYLREQVKDYDCASLDLLIADSISGGVRAKLKDPFVSFVRSPIAASEFADNTTSNSTVFVVTIPKGSYVIDLPQHNIVLVPHFVPAEWITAIITKDRDLVSIAERSKINSILVQDLTSETLSQHLLGLGFRDKDFMPRLHDDFENIVGETSIPVKIYFTEAFREDTGCVLVPTAGIPAYPNQTLQEAILNSPQLHEALKRGTQGRWGFYHQPKGSETWYELQPNTPLSEVSSYVIELKERALASNDQMRGTKTVNSSL